MVHTQERLEKIDANRKDFLDYMHTKDHEEYSKLLSMIVVNQDSYETSWIATGGEEKSCKDIVPMFFPSKLEIVGCNYAFDYIDKIICNHNRSFYNPELERGVLIDIVTGKKQTGLGGWRGKERSICLTPFIEGVAKEGVLEFISEIMRYKKIARGLVPNPLKSNRIIKGTQDMFYTCCDRISGDYFYLRGGREYFNMSVILPDINPKIDLRRHLKSWEEVENSPEIKLLSFMAYFLSNGDCLKIAAQPETTELTDEEKKGTKAEEIPNKEIDWEELSKNKKPRIFPDGEPIDPYQALSILNNYRLGELFSIFEPELIEEEYCDEGSTFKNNPYALCALISRIIQESERTLPNNEVYFRKSYPVDWKKFTNRKRKPADDRGSATPENLWGKSILID